MNSMKNSSNTLKNLIKQKCYLALLDAFPEKAQGLDLNLIEITEATQEKFGHYQCNSAMKLNKIMGVAPRIIAEKLVEVLQKQNTLQSHTSQSPIIFSKIEIAGPGFINFTLSPEYLSQITTEQLYDPRLRVPLVQKHPKPKVIIDYSSPNVAKEMHVGHLRTTIIGDCLARVFRFLGYEVLALNHIGDWGTQFGMLIAYLKEVLPEITGKTPPNVHLGDLVNWYRAAKKRFDEDLDFKKLSQQEVVHLQAGNVESLRAWKHICEISRQAYQTIYDLLDIHLIERGESFYNPHLPEIIQDLEQKDLISVSDGAKCMYLEGYLNRNGEPLPIILQKADGAYNYATTDLAALRHRVRDEKGDWIIYVVDAGQSLHFQMIFEAAQKAGYYDPKQVRLDHVEFGLVLRPDGKKFKTREGETERLIDLLMVAVDKAKEALQERNQDMSKEELESSSLILGIDAVKYADLSCHRTSDYMFSYDKMLSFEGNTAAFLLYAYVRILSIQRKTQVNIQELMKQHPSIVLQDPSEISLGLLVCRFREVLEQTIEELLPNRLTDYLYRLAEKFHLFFHQCRVEGSEQQTSRLLLCEVVARVLEQGLLLLGLKTLPRM